MSTPHVLIRASAGSGKTYQLSTRYLALLFGGADAGNILASTFTRKAAGEILERIFARLAAACQNDESAASLGEALKLEGLELREARATLSQLVGALDRIQVSTLDSFFARLASGFALDVGLPPRWRMMDESELAMLRLEAIQRMAERDRAATLRLWRLHNHEGGERSLSSQIDELANHAHRLFVEGDEAAWRFLEQELDGAPPTQEELHGLAAMLEALPDPDNKTWAKAIAKDCELLPDRNFKELLKGGLCRKVLDKEESFARKAIDAEYVAVYERIVDAARRELITRLASYNRSCFDLLQRFDSELQPLKRERGALFFDDLQRLLNNLRHMGELEQIFFRLETRIHHVLLDEFQDTSREQWSVLRPMITELASQDDGSESVFVVGDAKQAIYGWRGGDAEIFRGLHRELHLPDESLEELVKSWRSAPAVLEAVNCVFESLADNPQLADFPETVKHWLADFGPHEAEHAERRGRVMFHVAEAMEEPTETGQQAAVRACTVDLLAELSEAHPGVEIGVLVRRNAQLAQLRADLALRGIDASEEGGVSLARQPAVALLLSLLRVAEHPKDRIALFHLATSPLAETLGLTAPPRRAEGPRLSARLRRMLHRDGLRGCLLHHALALLPSCGVQSRARIRQLLAAAQRFERDENQRVADFLRWIEGGSIDDPSKAQIRLLTVHRSKGLQFPIVVLCDLEQNLSRTGRDAFLVGRGGERGQPDRISLNPSEAQRSLSPALRELAREDAERKMSERLSVLYVAMTRASHALHMVCTPDEKRRAQKSDAALLRAAFFPGGEPEPGSRTLLFGDEKVEIDAREDDRPLPRVMRRPKLARSETPRWSPAEAPSLHALGAPQPAAALLRLSEPTARLRGIALHRCFQGVGFSEDEVEDDASMLRGLRRELRGADDSALSDYLAEFHRLRALPEIRHALSRESYAAQWDDLLRLILWREHAFAHRDGDAIVRGRFDRVVLGCDDGGFVRAHVLDFKSDRVDPDDENELERLRELYTPQMQAYRRAIARRCRLPKESIECSLLFLSASLHLRL